MLLLYPIDKCASSKFSVRLQFKIQICQNNFALENIIITIKKENLITDFENVKREYIKLPKQ
jgi:hypothetical protein